MTTPTSLARDLAQSLDPVTLARTLGFDPDPWQAEVLRSHSKRVLLNCSRQSGKTTTAALLATWTAVYEPGSLCIVISASERQARELVRAAATFYRAMGRPIPSEAENRLSLELENRSRIIAIPASAATIRGYPGTRLLIVDEAAQVPDDVYWTIRPSLATSAGRLLLMSTPFGRRGFFYEAWKDRRSWDFQAITADQCPRITDEWLEEERASHPDWWVRQEYFCEFHDAESQAFSGADIERAIEEGIEEWQLSSAWM